MNNKFKKNGAYDFFKLNKKLDSLFYLTMHIVSSIQNFNYCISKAANVCNFLRLPLLHNV